jgi:hypothetical protein
MASSIADFKSKFETELARPNRFEVEIPPINGVGSLPDMGKFRCETAELPSRTFSTLEQKFGSNPVEKYPYQTTYNDLTLTFIVSGDMSEKKFFDNWMNVISPPGNFNFQYRNNYVGDITITQFDLSNKPVYSVVLHDAYPITVNQLDLDWSNNDSHHKLVVMFAYTYWTSK